MKRKLTAILVGLCSAFAAIGFASCNVEWQPDSGILDNYGNYKIELDASAFDGVVSYQSTVDCGDFTILYTANSPNGEFYQTKLSVKPEMVKGWDTTTTGAKEFTIEYDGESFTVPYTVKYQVDFIAMGTVVDTQYVLNASEIVKPQAPEKEGYTFSDWDQAIPAVINKNLTFEALYHDDSLQAPIATFTQVYDPKATLAGLTLPSNANGKWEFVDSLSTPIGDAGTHEFEVRFVPGTGSIANTANRTVEVTVSKQLVFAPTVSADLTYTGEVQKALVTDVQTGELLYTVVNEGGVNVGDYSVTVTLNDAKNYTWINIKGWTVNDDVLTYAYEIEQKRVTFDVEEKSYTYNGEAQFPAYTLSENVSVACSIEPKTNAGTYTYVLTVDDPNYVGRYAGEYTIARKKVDFVAQGTSFVYDGEAHAPTYTFLDPKDEENKANIPVDVISGQAQTEAGDYRYTWRVDSTVNPNYTGMQTVSFEITRPDVTVTAKNLTFTYPCEIPAAEDLYTVEGFDNVALLNIAVETPLTARVGTYVLAPIVGNTNVNATVINGALTIVTGTPTYSLPELSTYGDGKAAVYGDKLSSVELIYEGRGSWAWEDPDQRINTMGEFTATAIYTPQDSNYKTVSEVLTITRDKAIEKRSLTIKITGDTYAYTGEDLFLAYQIVDDLDPEYVIERDKYTVIGNTPAVTVGEYDRTLSLESACYLATVGGKLKIEKALPDVELTTTQATVKYDQSLTVEESISLAGTGMDKGQYAWAMPGAKLAAFSIDQETEVKVIYTPNDTDNYLTKELSFFITVTRADTTLFKWENNTRVELDLENGYSKVYDGNAFSFIARTNWSNNELSASSYVYKNIATGAESSTVTDVGEYELTITAPQTDYYNSASATVKVKITTATNTWTNAPSVRFNTWTYNNADETRDIYRQAAFGNGTETIVYTHVTTGDVYENTLPLDAKVGSYKAVVTVPANSNGNWTALTGEVEFAIQKATVNLPTLTFDSKPYSGLVIKPEVTVFNPSTTYKVSYSDENSTNAGKYSVKVTLDNPEGYVWGNTDKSEYTLTYKITQAANDITSLSMTGWAYRAYNETNNRPVAEALFGKQTATYSYYPSEADAEAKTKVLQAADLNDLPVGTYWVRADILETNNYAGASRIEDFAITNAAWSGTTQFGATLGPVVWNSALTLGNITLPTDGVGEYTWRATENALSTKLEVGTTEYKAVYTVPNYDPAYGTFFVQVVKETGSVSATSGKKFVYNSASYTLDTNKQCAALDTFLAVAPNSNYQDTAKISYEILYNGVATSEIKNAGEYTVKVMLAESAHYTAAETTVTLFVAQIENNQNINRMDATYGQTLGDLASTLASYNVTGEWTWKEGNDTPVGDATTGTTYRQHEAVFTPNDQVNYASRTLTVNVRVGKQSVVAPDLTVAGELTYTGAYLLPVTAGEFGAYKVEITAADTADNEAIGINAGTYTVKVSLLDTANYAWVSGSVTEKTYVIAKADNTWATQPSIADYAYTGNAPVYQAAATQTASISVVYYQGTQKLDGYPVDVGTYKGVFTAAELDNYNALTGEVTFDIEQADAAPAIFPAVTEIAWRADLMLSDVALPTSADGAYSWKEDKALANVASYEVEMIYTPTDTNYKAQTATVTVQVNKAKVTLSGIADDAKDYNDEKYVLPTPTATPEVGAASAELAYTYAYSEGAYTEMRAAGVYTVTITLADSEHYTFGTDPDQVVITITINKVDNVISALTIEDLTYDGSVQTPTVTTLEARNDDGAITYYYLENGVYTDQVPVNAGVYAVKVVIGESANYKAAEKVFANALTINKLEIAIPEYTKTFDYNATAQKPDLSETETYKVYWANENSINVNSYCVTLELKNVNHKWAGKADETRTVDLYYDIQKVRVSLSVTLQGWTYGGYDTETNKPSVTAADFAYVQYRYKDSEGIALAELSNALPVGTYSVQAYVVGTANYYDAETDWIDFTVAKATVGNAAIEALEDAAKEYTYNNTYQLPAVPTGTGYDVSISGKTFAGADITGDAIGVAAGEYTITLTAKSNYLLVGDKQTLSYDFIINKANNVVNVTLNSGWTYGQTAPTPTVTATYEGNIADQKLYVDGVECVSLPENAGNYTLKIVIPASDNYLEGASNEVTFTIEKADAEILGVANGAIFTHTYNGAEYVFTGITGSHTESSVAYAVQDGKTIKNVGSYTVTITLAESDNYNAATSKIVTVNVVKANATLEASHTEYTKVYDGTAFVFPDNAFSWHNEEGATLSYSYSGKNYNQDFPKGNGLPTDAGSYQVKVSLSASDNYNATEITVTVEITQVYVSISRLSAGLDVKLGDIALETSAYGTWSWVTDLNTVFDEVKTYQATAKFEPYADYYNNYATYQKAVTISIGQEEVTTTPNSAESFVYTKDGAEVTVSVKVVKDNTVLTRGTHYTIALDGTEQTSNTVKVTGVKEYKLVLTFIKVGGGYIYKWSDADGTVSEDGYTLTKTITVTQAPNIIADFTFADVVYSGIEVSDPSTTSDFGTVGYTYSTYDAASDTWSNYGTARPVEAGKYSVKASVPETTDYQGAELTKEFTITPATVTAELAADTLVYMGSAQTNDVIVTWGETRLTEGKVTYAVEGNVETDAADYEVKVTLANNYAFEDGTKETVLKFTIDPAEVTPEWTTEFTYNGSAQNSWIGFAEALKPGSVASSADNIGVSQYYVQDNVETDAGTYTYTVTLGNNYVFATSSDYTLSEDKKTATLEFTIKPATVTAELAADPLVYNGESQTKEVIVMWGETRLTEGDATYAVEGNEQKEAGNHEVKITLKNNFKFDESGTKEKTLTFSIDKSIITATLKDNSKNFVYDNTDKTAEFTLASTNGGTVPTLNGEDPTKSEYSFSGETQKAKGDNYQITVTLLDTTNYIFEDGTTTAYVSYKIAAADNNWVDADEDGKTDKPEMSKDTWTYGDPAGTLTMPTLYSTKIDEEAGLTPVVTYINQTTGTTYTSDSWADSTTKAEAGEYTVTIFVEGDGNWNDFTDETIKFTIEKDVMEIQQSTSVSTSGTATDDQPITIDKDNGKYLSTFGTTETPIEEQPEKYTLGYERVDEIASARSARAAAQPLNAGLYKITLTLIDPTNFQWTEDSLPNGITWESGDEEGKTFIGYWVIQPKPVGTEDINALNAKSAIYDGAYKLPVPVPTEANKREGYSYTINYVGGSPENFGCDAGEYKIVFTIDSSNYVFAIEIQAEYTFTINKAKVTAAISDSAHVYNAGTQSETIKVEAENKITVGYTVCKQGDTTPITEFVGINAGTYTYHVTLNDTANFEWDITKNTFKEGSTEIVELSFEIAPSQVTAVSGSLLYSGNTQTAPLTFSLVNEKGKLPENTEYSLSGNTTAQDQGDYSFTVTLTGNYAWANSQENVNGQTATLTFTITQAPNAWEEGYEPTISNEINDGDSNEYIYTGKPYTGTADATFGEPTITYYKVNEDNTETPCSAPVDVGTYKIVFAVAETNNYQGLSEEVEFKIIAQQVTKPTIKAQTSMYDSTKEHNDYITVIKGLMANTNMDAVNIKATLENDETAEEVTIHNANTYYIWISLKNPENITNYEWNDAYTNSISFTYTITPETVTIDPKTYPATYGDLLSSIQLPKIDNVGYWKWSDEYSDTQTVGNVQDENTYTAVFVPANSNYTGDNTTVTIDVTKADATITATAKTGTFVYGASKTWTVAELIEYKATRDDDKTDSNLEVTWTITKGNATTTEIKDAGTYTVTFTLTDTAAANYGADDVSVTVTITPATVTAELTGDELTYNWAHQDSGYTVLNGASALDSKHYSVDVYEVLKDSTRRETTKEEITNAGDYVIVITLGSSNYTFEIVNEDGTTTNTNTEELPYTVNKAQNAWDTNGVTFNNTSWTYNTPKPLPQLLSTTKDNSSATITLTYTRVYEGKTYTGTTTTLNGLGAGKYTITKISVEGTDNWKGFVDLNEYTFTITPISLNTTPSLSGTESLVYKDNPHEITIDYDGSVAITYEVAGTTIDGNSTKIDETTITYDGYTFNVTHAGAYVVTLIAPESYVWKDGSRTKELNFQVAIADNAWKAEYNPTIINIIDDGDPDNYIYTGTPYTGTAKANFSAENEPTITYYEGTEIIESKKMDSAPVNVGTYTILFAVEETSNYKSFSAYITFTINKAQITLEGTLEAGTYYQNQLAFKDATNATSATVSYTDNTKTTDKTTDVATYTALGVDADNDGNKDVLTGTFTFGHLDNQLSGEIDSNGNKYFTVTFTQTNPNYVLSVSQNVTITLQNVAYIGSTHYPTIEYALSVASANNTVYVTPDKTGNVIIARDCTIGSNVTLCLPYDTSGNWQNRENAGVNDFADSSTYRDTYLQSLVTIASNVTLTVKGALQIGGEIGRQGQNLNGQTSGNYAEIMLNEGAIIEIPNTATSATIECCGYIKESVLGNGSQVIANAGMVYAPFVVYDFRGGTSTVGSYAVGVEDGTKAITIKTDGTINELAGKHMPFNEFDMPNIQSFMTIGYNAALVGYADLWTDNPAQHNLVDIPVISNPDRTIGGVTGGIINLTATTSKAIVKYTPETLGYTSKSGGTTSITLRGGAALGSMKMLITMGVSSIQATVAVSTADVFFAVCWKYQIALESGTFNIDNKLKLLSGATLTVGKDATLNIGGDMIIYPESVWSEDENTPQNFYGGGGDGNGANDGNYPAKNAAQLIATENGVINITGNLGGEVIAKSADVTLTVSKSNMSVTTDEGFGEADIDIGGSIGGVIGGIFGGGSVTINCTFTAQDTITQSFKIISHLKLRDGNAQSNAADMYITEAGTYYGAKRVDGTGLFTDVEYAWVPSDEVFNENESGDIYDLNFEFYLMGITDTEGKNLTALTDSVTNIPDKSFTYAQTIHLTPATYTNTNSTNEFVFKGWYKADENGNFTYDEKYRIREFTGKEYIEGGTIYGVFAEVATAYTITFVSNRDGMTVDPIGMAEADIEKVDVMLETLYAYEEINDNYITESKYLSHWVTGDNAVVSGAGDLEKAMFDSDNALTLTAVWVDKRVVNFTTTNSTNTNVIKINDNNVVYLHPDQTNSWSDFTEYTKKIKDNDAKTNMPQLFSHWTLGDTTTEITAITEGLFSNTNAITLVANWTNKASYTFNVGALSSDSGYGSLDAINIAVLYLNPDQNKLGVFDIRGYASDIEKYNNEYSVALYFSDWQLQSNSTLMSSWTEYPGDAANHVLVAQWTEKYAITAYANYNSSANSAAKPSTWSSSRVLYFNEGQLASFQNTDMLLDEIATINENVEANYYFTHWAQDATGTAIDDISKISAIYAQWTAKHTLTVVANGRVRDGLNRTYATVHVLISGSPGYDEDVIAEAQGSIFNLTYEKTVRLYVTSNQTITLTDSVGTGEWTANASNYKDGKLEGNATYTVTHS